MVNDSDNDNNNNTYQKSDGVNEAVETSLGSWKWKAGGTSESRECWTTGPQSTTGWSSEAVGCWHAVCRSGLAQTSWQAEKGAGHGPLDVGGPPLGGDVLVDPIRTLRPTQYYPQFLSFTVEI